ncbi:MAG: DUF1761 domain-containing protein [Cohaesibacter sp.]|nr:DUF1761 domain-containing protein [Cohaesibacter sp.]
MPLNEVNWLSAVLSAFFGYGLGAVWYMTLAKPWMAAAGLSESDIKGPDGKQSPIPFIIAAFANLVIATMLYGILAHVGDFTPWRGFVSGLMLWIGFVLTTQTVNYTYQMKPVRLLAIDSGYWLLNLCAQGTIQGWFGEG